MHCQVGTDDQMVGSVDLSEWIHWQVGEDGQRLGSVDLTDTLVRVDTLAMCQCETVYCKSVCYEIFSPTSS